MQHKNNKNRKFNNRNKNNNNNSNNNKNQSKQLNQNKQKASPKKNQRNNDKRKADSLEEYKKGLTPNYQNKFRVKVTEVPYDVDILKHTNKTTTQYEKDDVASKDEEGNWIFMHSLEEADNIPSDPQILVSYINTKLRDKYNSLDELCEQLDINKELLIKKLDQIDYKYEPNYNKFI